MEMEKEEALPSLRGEEKMQVTRAEALCQEFCDSVAAEEKPKKDSEVLFKTKIELKCKLSNAKYFPELISRMAEIGYCCTQVQRDLGANKCVAWFEEAASDRQ